MSTRSNRSRPLMLAAATMLPLLANAQPPAPGPMSFGGFDRDGNGIITAEEFGSVHAERMAARAQQGLPMRGAANAPAFTDFDADGDGRITPQEFTAFQQQRRGLRPGGGMGPGAGMGPGIGRGPGMGRGAGMGPGAGMGRGMGMPAFSDFDTDGDGSLTKDEFYSSRAQQMGQRAAEGLPMHGAGSAPTFEAIDRDGDGRIGPDELAAAQAEHRRQMMQAPPPQP